MNRFPLWLCLSVAVHAALLWWLNPGLALRSGKSALPGIEVALVESAPRPDQARQSPEPSAEREPRNTQGRVTVTELAKPSARKKAPVERAVAATPLPKSAPPSRRPVAEILPVLQTTAGDTEPTSPSAGKAENASLEPERPIASDEPVKESSRASRPDLSAADSNREGSGQIETEPEPAQASAPDSTSEQEMSVAPKPSGRPAGKNSEAVRKQAYEQLLSSLRRHFRYPLVARKRGWQGDVVLIVELKPDGRVASVALGSGSGHEALDRAALASMASVDRIPVTLVTAERFELPVRYRLVN